MVCVWSPLYGYENKGNSNKDVSFARVTEREQAIKHTGEICCVPLKDQAWWVSVCIYISFKPPLGPPNWPFQGLEGCLA